MSLEKTMISNMKALYLHSQVPQILLNAMGPLIAYSQAASFLSDELKELQNQMPVPFRDSNRSCSTSTYSSFLQPKPLFSKIESEQADDFRKRFAGRQQTVSQNIFMM